MLTRLELDTPCRSLLGEVVELCSGPPRSNPFLMSVRKMKIAYPLSGTTSRTVERHCAHASTVGPNMGSTDWLATTHGTRRSVRANAYKVSAGVLARTTPRDDTVSVRSGRKKRMGPKRQQRGRWRTV